MGSDDIYDIPAPDAIPDNPAQLYEWDRANSLLSAEWARFWERVGDHERDQSAKLGKGYRGLNRARACQAFRVRLRARYGATDPSDVWCTYDDERRRTLGKQPRPVFKTGPMAQSREHLEHWMDR